MRSGRPRRRGDRQPGRPLALAAAAQQCLRRARASASAGARSPSRSTPARRPPHSMPCAGPTSPASRSRCRTRLMSPDLSTSAATSRASSPRSTASTSKRAGLRHQHRRRGLPRVARPRRGVRTDGQALRCHRCRRRGAGGHAGLGPGRRLATSPIVNRTPERAFEAAGLAGSEGTVVPLTEGAIADAVAVADLVVNATPIGMDGRRGGGRWPRRMAGRARPARSRARWPPTWCISPSDSLAGGGGCRRCDHPRRPGHARPPSGGAARDLDRSDSSRRGHVARGRGGQSLRG